MEQYTKDLGIDMGDPKKCVLCNTTEGRLEWSNKNHKYRFIRKEWWSLCVKCHRHYDKKKFGSKPAWNKGKKGLQEWHNISGLLKAPWNKGIKSKKEVTCGHCRRKFYPPKKTSRYCSKSCASFSRT